MDERGRARRQILAVVCAIGLIVTELRQREPLLELRFFASLPFSAATVIAFGAFFALTGFLFLNTLYLQDGRHLTALRAGLCTTPMAAMIALLSTLAGRLMSRTGPRLP